MKRGRQGKTDGQGRIGRRTGEREKKEDDITQNLSARTHMYPLNAFPHVFLLLLFQHQLNEQLLELLIAVVDAELLKASRQNCTAA